jgi:hypothetical protein
MSTSYPCAFVVPPESVGGKLSGGFTSGAPTLQNGDSIVVSVSFDAANPNAPVTLTGMFVYTASPQVSNQTTPSPFVIGANKNFVCLSSQQAPAVASGSNKVYTFAPIVYTGGQPGQYELTFIAINPNGSPQGDQMQWSEDPEFETGN